MNHHLMYNADDHSTVPHIPSRHADHGSSSTYRLSPRDEPHPYSLRRRRDSDITRRQSSSENIIHYSSYRERARRAGLIYQRFPISDNPESVHITQTSSNILPPPYKSGGSPPPYSSISRSQDYNDGMGPRRSRSGHNSQHRWRRSFPFSWRMR